jgi:hypothetical protein
MNENTKKTILCFMRPHDFKIHSALGQHLQNAQLINYEGEIKEEHIKNYILTQQNFIDAVILESAPKHKGLREMIEETYNGPKILLETNNASEINPIHYDKYAFSLWVPYNLKELDAKIKTQIL